MTEEEYIVATNRTKVSIALTIMRDVYSGDGYGISDEDSATITKLLSAAQFALYDRTDELQVSE